MQPFYLHAPAYIPWYHALTWWTLLKLWKLNLTVSHEKCLVFVYSHHHQGMWPHLHISQLWVSCVCVSEIYSKMEGPGLTLCYIQSRMDGFEPREYLNTPPYFSIMHVCVSDIYSRWREQGKLCTAPNIQWVILTPEVAWPHLHILPSYMCLCKCVWPI